MFGRSRAFVALLFVLGFVIIAWRTSRGPAVAGEARAAGHVERVTVQGGTPFGESQPLVVTPATSDRPVHAVAPQIAADKSVSTERVDLTSDNERSILVASRVEHDANATIANASTMLASYEAAAPQPQQSGRIEEREEYYEEAGEAGEEHEEMPANAVAQGNTRTQQPSREAMMAVPEGSAAVEQTTMGTKPAPNIVASFDGLGAGFQGPHGFSRGGNPSDNSIAVGPDHVVVTVNSQMAVFTKKGNKFSESGRVLYGPVNTGNVFKDCGGCDRNNGDAVVRYDQLADRWLIVMPIFSRLPATDNEPEPGKGGEPAQWSKIGREDQPGPAADMPIPPALNSAELAAQSDATRGRGEGRGRGRGRGQGGGRGRGAAQGPRGSYAMCYAISTSSDPLGSYYRYHFVRPLFPDYPRPAVWPDGYYVPTSTGDNRISPEIATQKHACVVEREAMLKGEPAREQCAIIENVNFLNNADLDGKELPPAGAPNIMMAAGGTQLDEDLEDDGIYAWKISVNWDDPSKTKFDGPEKITVAPYNYMLGGQLTRFGVPQKDSETRLDTQGDKIMSRLVYRRIGDQESIVGVHSINATGGGGGVRWYEFRIDRAALTVKLHQQGTYAPGGNFRWMASPAIDKFGNIGIGYSYGGADKFPGQRFAARQPNDPLGQMTLEEAVLIEGQAAQEGQIRWQDYVQTAVDPSDDCTIWYVGDYVKYGNTRYSSRVGAFRLPGCEPESTQ
jgi:hypothetical protein